MLGTRLAPHSPNGSGLPFSLTQVQVELKKGETIMTDASLHLPAAFLHEAFSNRSGVPPDHFELYYRGKRLEGEAALASWGVGKDSTIEVKMRGRGGMLPGRKGSSWSSPVAGRGLVAKAQQAPPSAVANAPAAVPAPAPAVVPAPEVEDAAAVVPKAAGPAAEAQQAAPSAAADAPAAAGGGGISCGASPGSSGGNSVYGDNYRSLTAPNGLKRPHAAHAAYPDQSAEETDAKATVKAMNATLEKEQAKIAKAKAAADSLLLAYCSITVQNVFALDKRANTYQCFFELDFKYEVNQYLEVFGTSSVKADDADIVSADTFQIPWIIPNALEKTVERENHFFRVKEKKDDPGPDEMSMYDDESDLIDKRTDSTTDSLRAEHSTIEHSVKMDEITSGLVVKHEKIVMTATLRYNTDSSLEPLDQIFACIKVATDGRPGTKRTKFILAESDCSFDGFEQGLAGYEPYRAPMKQGLAGKGASLFRRLLALCSWHSKMREGLGKAEVFALTFDFEQSYSGQYPRIYFFQRFKHPFHVWWEDYFRYYLTSYTLTLLLAAVHPGYTFSVSASDAFNGGRSNRSWTPESNDLNQNDLVALFSGIFLADIALLFTASANGSKESYNQKAITKNLLSAILLAICMFYGYYEQDGIYYGLPRWIQITVVFTVATSVLLYMTVSHYFKALQKNTRIAERVSKFGTSLPTVKQRAAKARKQAEQGDILACMHEAKPKGLAGRCAAKLGLVWHCAARQEAKRLEHVSTVQAKQEMEEETEAKEETKEEKEVKKILMQQALKYLDTL